MLWPGASFPEQDFREQMFFEGEEREARGENQKEQKREAGLREVRAAVDYEDPRVPEDDPVDCVEEHGMPAEVGERPHVPEPPERARKAHAPECRAEQEDEIRGPTERA